MIETERAYLSDPFTLEFRARVVGRETLPDGRFGVVLDRTYFYPTGGGQEHDTGTLGDATVLDVESDDAGRVLHIVDRPVLADEIEGRVDRERRFAFMQHHSAQHLLSAAVDQVLGLETIAVHISINSPSTIDFPVGRIDAARLERAEQLANAIIYEDRPIKSYSVSEEQVAALPLRRPPKVHGEIRIVEIDRFDYSACGGTHCTVTGMIGIVKVLKAERRGEETRVYFVAGALAFKLLSEEHAALTLLSQRLNANPETAVAALDRQFEQVESLEAQLKELKEQKIALEARELAATAENRGGARFILGSYTGRPAQELRRLGSLLQNEQGLVAVLLSFDAGKISAVVSCGAASGFRANDVIKRLLAPIGGKGGGDARLAQGGGSGTEEQVKEIAESARETASWQ